MHLPDRIFLTGMPGSGKSTLGKQLAGHLRYRFIDLDEAIEQEEGKTIAGIFQEKGENGFRQVESAVLKKHLTLQKVVVATGGGTPCFFDNMDAINRSGVSIYLDVPVSTLKDRLHLSNIAQRPKLAGAKALSHTLSETLSGRKPFYEKATYQAEGADISVEKLVAFFLTV